MMETRIEVHGYGFGLSGPVRWVLGMRRLRRSHAACQLGRVGVFGPLRGGARCDDSLKQASLASGVDLGESLVAGQPQDELTARGDPEPGVDVAEVVLDRLHADHQLLGDLPVVSPRPTRRATATPGG